MKKITHNRKKNLKILDILKIYFFLQIVLKLCFQGARVHENDATNNKSIT